MTDFSIRSEFDANGAATTVEADVGFKGQNLSGAETRTKLYEFSLLGGLEYDGTTFTANADHADTTLTAGILYGVDMSVSALTGEVIFDLPLEANIEVGERVGVYITAGSSTDGEELAIRTGAVGDTINGTDYNASDWSRLFITGELVIFRCVNKTTQADYIVEYDGRIPCECVRYNSTSQDQAVDDTLVQMELDSVDINVGNLDGTADQITVRRAGKYLGRATVRPSDDIAVNTGMEMRLRVDGITKHQANNAAGSNATNWNSLECSGILDLADGDGFEGWARFNFDAASYLYQSGSTMTSVSLVEIL